MLGKTTFAMAVFVTLLTGNLGSGVSAPTGRFEFSQKTSVANAKILTGSGPVQKSCCPARPSCCGEIAEQIGNMGRQYGVSKLSELGVCFSPMEKGIVLEDLTLEISSKDKVVFRSAPCKDCKRDFPPLTAGKESREGYLFTLDGTALQAAEKLFRPENVIRVRGKYSGTDAGAGTLFLVKIESGNKMK
jgi:hypothetical protein